MYPAQVTLRHPARRLLPLLCGGALALGAQSSAAEREPAAPPERVSSERARMPTLSPAEIDDALAIGGETIEGRKLVSRMTVGVRVNGAGPYRFVVDSGADTSVVGERLANGLKLPPGRRVILNSITDSQLVDRVLVDELELGPSKVTGLELPVLRERDLGAEGMLGLDALVEQRLMLDFENRLITVDEGRTPAPLYDDMIVVTARLRKGQLILTQVKADRTKLEAVVDTGSEITIGNSALRRQLMRHGQGEVSEIEVTGVTGTVAKLTLMQVKELRIGGIALANVPIAFADIPPFGVFGLADRPALLIGTDLMENFRKVSLDFHKRKVRFQLKRCKATGLLLRTSTRHATRLSTDTPAACAR